MNLATPSGGMGSRSCSATEMQYCTLASTSLWSRSAHCSRNILARHCIATQLAVPMKVTITATKIVTRLFIIYTCQLEE
jgi:hypothetical protein